MPSVEKLNYKQYLKSKHWKSVKKKFISKTWKRCWLCRSKNNLQVHHKRYTRNGVSILFKEKHTDFRLLCDNCHKKIHKLKLEEILASSKTRRKELLKIIKIG